MVRCCNGGVWMVVDDGVRLRIRTTSSSSCSVSIWRRARRKVAWWRCGGAKAAGRRGGGSQAHWPRSGPWWVGSFTLTSPVSWVCWCGQSRMAAAGVAYVQQRGGRDFTDPTWARPGLLGLVCPCCRVWSTPANGSRGRLPGGCAAVALRFQPTYAL
jgi:hypothetical protein